LGSKKSKTIEAVMGRNGLIQMLVNDVLKNILETEMEENLARYKYERNNSDNKEDNNYRNSHSEKISNCMY